MTSPAADQRFCPPDVAVRAVADHVAHRFGCVGTATRLRGEREQNVRIVGPDGAWVAKVAWPDDRPAIELQHAALRHLAAMDASLVVPRVVVDVDGADIVAVELDGETVLLRVLTHVPGVTFEPATDLPDDALGAIGAWHGRLTSALATLAVGPVPHPMPWDPASGSLDDEALWATLGADARAVAEPLRPRCAAAVAALPHQRQALVHHDVHRGNLLRPDAGSVEVAGLIDFGDLTMTALVADPAVALASFAAPHPRPRAAARAMLDGFVSACPLDADERALVHELVLCRLVLHLLFTDFHIATAPHLADDALAERAEVLGACAAWHAVLTEDTP